MLELTLQRISEHENVKKPNSNKAEGATLGKIELKEGEKLIWEGYTCENAGPSTDDSETDKRIMPGEYYLEWCASSRNGSLVKRYPEWKNKDGSNVAIWVKRKGDKKFDNRLIRIHTGNYPQDTLGCILIGRAGANGIVTDSVNAIHEFFTILKEKGLKEVKFIVKEINK